MTVRTRRAARPRIEVAGYSVVAARGRVYLVDVDHRDPPDLTATQARALAAALVAAAEAAAKQTRRPDPEGQP